MGSISRVSLYRRFKFRGDGDNSFIPIIKIIMEIKWLHGIKCFINHFRGHLAFKVLFNADHKTGPTTRKKILTICSQKAPYIGQKSHKHQKGAWTSSLTNINGSLYLECSLQENIQKELEHKKYKKLCCFLKLTEVCMSVWRTSLLFCPKTLNY